MARKLDDRLQPDEQVLFQTRLGRRHLGWVALKTLVGTGLLTLTVITLFVWDSIELDVPSFVALFSMAALGTALIVPFALLVTLPTVILWKGASALLTDERLLYRAPLRRRVVEIPLWHIQSVAESRRRVTLRDRTGARLNFTALSDPRGLGRAIVAEAGVPGPADLDDRLFRWWRAGSRFLHYSATAAYGAAVIFGYFVPDAHGAFDALVPDSAAAQFGVVLPIVIAVGLTAYVAGATGAALLAILVMRRRLSAAEVRLIYDYSRDMQAREKIIWPFRLPTRVSRRFAGLVYGEPV